MHFKVIVDSSRFSIRREIPVLKGTIGSILCPNNAARYTVFKLTSTSIHLHGNSVRINGLRSDVLAVVNLFNRKIDKMDNLSPNDILLSLAQGLKIGNTYYQGIPINARVAPQVLGKGFCNIESIKEKTNTKIRVINQVAWIRGEESAVTDAIQELSALEYLFMNQFTRVYSVKNPHLMTIAKTLEVQAKTKTLITMRNKKYVIKGLKENVNKAVGLIKLIMDGLVVGNNYSVELIPAVNGARHLEIVFPHDSYFVHMENILTENKLPLFEAPHSAKIKILSQRGMDLTIDVLEATRL